MRNSTYIKPMEPSHLFSLHTAFISSRDLLKYPSTQALTFQQSLTLPAPTDHHRRLTSRRNVKTPIRIRFPRNRPITRHINKLILKAFPRRKANRNMPQRIPRRVQIRTQRNRLCRIPTLQNRIRANNLDRLAKRRRNFLIERHRDGGCEGAGLRRL